MRLSSLLSCRILRVLLVIGLLAGKPLPAQNGPLLSIAPYGTNGVQITWPPGTNFNVLEQALGLDDPSSWVDVADAPSPLGLLYSVRAAATNGATFYRLAQRGTPGVTTPPDPALVASALAPNVYNPFGQSTAFLYTGANPIQIGVAPGTINAVQAAVLRGTVTARDNTPLPGVRVALLNHPEFGYTYTRTNGMFDMAVNAAQYAVDFEAIGYFPVQRQAQLTGQSYYTLPPVVMIGVDPMTTVVTLGSNSPLQVAHSTQQTDAAGSRSATVFFPPGTTATMVMPDGSTQPATTMTVRVTEYSVGSNGMAAMPAALPPFSGYTYCADITTDEEVAAGATTVVFSQPLPVYLDNFLNVPVGTLVPTGDYHRTDGLWYPSSNGIVMMVLGSSNGIALVDLHGTGQPEPTNVLAANGFTTAELEQIASDYPAGKTLWRCQVPHFSQPWDFNFSILQADPNKPNKPGQKPKCSNCDNSSPDYGTINFSSQVFAEQIPLVGVPFALNYSSARVPDYHVLSELTVPVKWVPPPPVFACTDLGGNVECAEVPNLLDFPPSNIRVDLSVSGEDSTQILPESSTTATVSWDGRDAYGRLVGGSAGATITVAYEYTNWDCAGIFWATPFDFLGTGLFGNDGNDRAFAGHIGTTLGVGATFQQVMTHPDHRGLGFGGWSPTVLHRLDPVAGILYYGDGRIGSVPQESILDNFLTQITDIQRIVAATPDGSIYYYGQLSVGNENFIFRRLPGGSFQKVSVSSFDPGAVYPNGLDWTKIDGQSVTNVSFDGVDLSAMCAGPDGSIYVTDSYDIARLTPDGIWHVILGLNASYPATMPADGTPAQNAAMTAGGRVAMAAGPDNSLYYTSVWGPDTNGMDYCLIRRIAPDGNIYTVFGAPGASAATGGLRWNQLYGSSAYSAPYGGGPIAAIAVGNDGTIYVSPGEEFDSGGIFQISTGGIILPFLTAGPLTGAGAGYNPSDTNQIIGDEGKLATDVTSGNTASLMLAVGPDGSVYFSGDTIIVWRVNPNGILERVAGRYSDTNYSVPNYPIDEADPLNTYMYSVEAMAVTPDDTLALVNDQLAPYLLLYPGRDSQQGLLVPIQTRSIPSDDGSEIYVFDQNGRHLTTMDSLTGATKWTFAYDANSLVVTMTDAVGNMTQIQRDGAGNPTAIVGPYGQTTTLGLDANGFLNKVSNPANETTAMTSTSGGLLSSITGPLSDTYSVAYDNVGRAIKVSDAIGGGWSDTYTDVGVLPDLSYEVNIACTNSLGDTLFRYLNLATDGSTSVAYYAGTNGIEGSTVALNGNESFSFIDSAGLYVAVGSDPRFGSQVPLPTAYYFQLTTNLPYYTVSIQRSTGLTNSANPLSLTGLTNVTTINGNAYTEIYNATNRTLTSNSPAGRTESVVLDSLGRVSQVSPPGLPLINITYDNNGRLAAVTNTSSLGTQVTTLAYNSLGQVSTVRDPLNRSTSFSYDAAGRIQQQVLADGSIVGLTHDSEYNVTSLTPPGRPAHAFQYNLVGLLTKYTPPIVGTDDSISCQYDTERNMTQINFPDGQQWGFQRGIEGRIDSTTLGSGETISYSYGAGNGTGIFQVTNISSTSGNSLQFGYIGPILTGIAWSGAVTGLVSVQLNTDLRPSSESVNASAVAFSYDQDLNLTQAGGLTLTRDPSSAFVTGTTLGGVTDQRTFNNGGLLTNYTASLNSTSTWSLSFSYDLINRLTNKVETIGGESQTFGYIYDAVGRLQQVWLNGALNVTYTYDTNGNWLTRNSETATYDAQDRVTAYAGTNFAWSPNGTLLSASDGGQTTFYTYDVRGSLTAVSLPGGTQLSYILDPAGHRIGKKVNGVLNKGWLWSGAVPIAQVDSNSQVTEQFVYGSRFNVPDYIITPAATYRILSDERGSVRLVVNIANGAVAQQLDYDEFGRVLEDFNPGFQPFGFAGGLYDPDTGLVRFGLRDFNSNTGQWLGRDPFGFRGGLAMYAYVNNDPLNFIDPVGCGPYSLLFYNGAKTVIGFAGAAIALTALPEAAVGYLGWVVVGAAINSGYTLVTSTINTIAISQYGNAVPLMPTTIASAMAMGVGNYIGSVPKVAFL